MVAGFEPMSSFGLQGVYFIPIDLTLYNIYYTAIKGSHIGFL